VLGRRTAAIYFGAVVVSALGGGLLLEYLLADRTWAVPAMLDHAHAVDGPSWFGHVAAAVLVAVVLMARFRRPSGPSDEKESGLNEQRIELAVAGMTCSHCRGSVERTLADQPGVRRAQVDLERGQAKVAGHGLDAQQLADAINALGFQASIVSTS
jgi:copper chaperone CopZ